MAYDSAYPELASGLSARHAAHNAELMAAQSLRRRGAPTPEIFFSKRIDNSRLVKAPDMARQHQMNIFSVTAAFLFTLVMVYGLQHFNSIEMGYRVEADRHTLDQLREQNRQLRLSEAQLTQPDRIDRMARALGLSEPLPGQVVQPGGNPNDGTPSAPSLAQVAGQQQPLP